MTVVRHLRQEHGFTLMELLVASAMTVVVLGGAVALTSQIQGGYRRQIEDSAGEQEARYALEWIGRSLRSVGNNPHNINTATFVSECPPFGGFVPLVISATSITLQSDSNPSDGQIGGPSGGCTQTGENVTISFDANLSAITFNDLAVGTGATARTDAVIAGLQFNYFGSDRITEITDMTNAGAVFYVQTTITIRPRTAVNLGTGLTTRTVTSVTRVRGR
jgi:Tfp pilus assembly protein PilW